MVTSHANPLEVVEAAVGVVDVAWTALERHRDHTSHDSVWQDCVKLEGLLAEERSENERLRSALEECRKALQELQQRGTSLTFPVFSDCPPDLYELLKTRIDSPAFLGKVNDMHLCETDLSSQVKKEGEDILVNGYLEDSSGWLWVPDDALVEEKEEIDHLDNDHYVVVSQDEVLDAVAAFVAKIIVSYPNAKKMSPKEIQEVLVMAFKRLERKGKLQKLWSVAKFLYVGASWTTAAIGWYKNIFILSILFKGLSLSSRLLIKLL